MSKECPKCKTTNYDSATICSRCGYKFSDGAYYIGDNIANIKTQKKTIDKSAKILISIIAVIVCLIIFLVVFFVASNLGNTENTDTSEDAAQGSAITTEPSGSESYNKSNNSGFISGFQEQQAVDWEKYIPVEEIQLNYNEIELEVGQTIQFEATILPKDATNKEIYWQSSDSQIIDVVDGFATAMAQGEAQIWVVGENDKYATCNVVVTSAKELIEPESTFDYGEFIVTAETFLSLRYGPGTDYDEIERINKDEIVKVYAYEEDQNGKRWAFVEYNNELGWVYDKFLDDIPEEITEE